MSETTIKFLDDRQSMFNSLLQCDLRIESAACGALPVHGPFTLAREGGSPGCAFSASGSAIRAEDLWHCQLARYR